MPNPNLTQLLNEMEEGFEKRFVKKGDLRVRDLNNELYVVGTAKDIRHFLRAETKKIINEVLDRVGKETWEVVSDPLYAFRVPFEIRESVRKILNKNIKKIKKEIREGVE